MISLEDGETPSTVLVGLKSGKRDAGKRYTIEALATGWGQLARKGVCLAGFVEVIL
ncbi:hypothetical protein OOK60_08860 [Trichothermofontia sichuanensis B231]|uniref:hypothetical protein n=1 Tax=Trichothermofontia sichuanensis TaxID=3045816 RepID=UPI002246C6CB|nr:hypothetical protein [Trichothermofontia sichuanensis]UZQ56144.1 hypothetical protein OOK60_08860 [Trichothermofontia sichuanensis B231]